MPDLNDRLPRMPSNHTVGGKNEGWIPNIVGELNFLYHRTSTVAGGAFYERSTSQNTTIGTGTYMANYYVAFDASRVWSGYKNNVTNIMARNLCIRFLIKYI